MRQHGIARHRLCSVLVCLSGALLLGACGAASQSAEEGSRSPGTAKEDSAELTDEYLHDMNQIDWLGGLSNNELISARDAVCSEMVLFRSEYAKHHDGSLGSDITNPSAPLLVWNAQATMWTYLPRDGIDDPLRQLDPFLIINRGCGGASLVDIEAVDYGIPADQEIALEVYKNNYRSGVGELSFENPMELAFMTEWTCRALDKESSARLLDSKVDFDGGTLSDVDPGVILAAVGGLLGEEEDWPDSVKASISSDPIDPNYVEDPPTCSEHNAVVAEAMGLVRN